MARHAPQGDKNGSSKKKHKDKQFKEGTNSDSSVISYDEEDTTVLQYDEEFDMAANYELLQKQMLKKFEEKLKLQEAQFCAKLETLTNIIDKKETAIAKLNQKVGELTGELNCLKDSHSFMSNETTVMKEKIESTSQAHERKITELQNKSEDLEDRGRRNNLVFYGIKEPENTKEVEDCEKILHDILQVHNLVPRVTDTHNLFDRVHRLGRKREDQDKPRPIIARFTFYKDKEDVYKQGFKLKNTPINMSEAFSKATLNIRSQLVMKAKLAKNNESMITGFRVNYKRLVMKYTNPATNVPFYRGFNLQEIQNNPYWYIPRKLNNSFPSQSPSHRATARGGAHSQGFQAEN